jgi:radical SAM protein with 4Fe4S-binding SPASM domain
MKKLNKYIYKCNENIINLTTKKSLPLDSSYEVLEKNFFLEGQEKQSIEEYLFNPQASDYISIKIVPTWECNLRCSHCFVLNQLKKNDSGSKINIENLKIFLNQFINKYNKKFVNFRFLGGEPALRAKENYQLIKELRSFLRNANAKCYFSCTSNGLEMSEDIKEFYLSLDSLCISLDGSKKYHNEQRKSIGNIKNPYKKTLNNIKLLIKLGMKELVVQAAFEDQGYEEKNILKFYEKVLLAGVKYKNIVFGSIVPTTQKPEINKKYLETISSAKINFRQCCTYRVMSEFILDSYDNLYSDYFDIKNTCIGKTTDSIESIKEKYIETIRKHMPVLQDENCMDCPVIGACWGGCSNSKNIKPSSICNQKLLYEKIKEKEKDGTLVEAIYKNIECKN